MIRRALLFLALFGGTYAACDAHAATDECTRAMSAAEASAFTAARKLGACLDPAECRVARELVRASQAQLDAARAMCDVAPPKPSQADPFEADAADDTDPAGWVVTEQVAEAFAWTVRP